MAALAIVAQTMGFSPDQVENLKTATGEAVTNAIEHGNQNTAGTKATIKFIVQADRLLIIVTDEGLKPIPHISTERGERKDDRGWGMPFIRKFMDEVTTVAKAGQNEITMVAYLSR
jgi:serine/threonine-protein kinase RsbW